MDRFTFNIGSNTSSADTGRVINTLEMFLKFEHLIWNIPGVNEISVRLLFLSYVKYFLKFCILLQHAVMYNVTYPMIYLKVLTNGKYLIYSH